MGPRNACLIVVLAAACASTVLGAGATTRVVLTVTPHDVLIDQPVAITVSGRQPGSTVRLTATTTDMYRHEWRSAATFRADASGRVAVSTAPSLAGSYRGRDGMGLFKWMRLTGTRTPLNQQALFPATVSTVRFVASQRGKTLASATLTRRTQGGGVTERKTTLARERFIGCYYSAARAAKPAPAILYLGGSGGGLPCSIETSLLASHGYPVLVLAYYNVPGLPARLDRIPLEYFKRALEWLARQPGVDANRLVTMGLSKGGEAALLLGASYPTLVHAAVEYVGVSTVNSAYSFPSWTRNGKPVLTGTVIPVWKINGPLFLVGGTDDLSGASFGAVENTVSLLKAHHSHNYTALVYRGAGHMIGWAVPNLPFGTTYLHFGVPHYMGGTLAADSAARSDSWPRLLAFLDR